MKDDSESPRIMSESEIVFDVGGGDFERRVLSASHKRPIVVDFWAPWCAPCRMLGPVLEKVVLSYKGKIRLARLNIDENRDVAAAWRIQSIPAVVIFKDGKPVSSFIGAQPESEVQRIISSVVPTEADELVLKADRLAGEGNVKEAESSCRRALELMPEHSGALTGLAKLLLDKGDRDEAKALVESVPPGSRDYAEARSISARIEFAEICEAAGGRAACERGAADNPENLDALFGLACCLAEDQKYKEALDHLLKIVEIDKLYGEGKAKDAMLRIFSIVGERSELADDYRSRLSMALY